MHELTEDFKRDQLEREKHHYERFIGEGARPEIILEVYNKVKTLEDWPKEFGKVGDNIEKAADGVKDNKVRAMMYLDAILYRHLGSLAIFEDTEEKKKLYYDSLEAYKKAAPYFWAPAERIEFPFKKTTLKGFFRKSPNAASKQAPCIISVHGADACGLVEGHYMTNFILDKGMHTIEFDLPGQYEARFEGMYMAPEEFEKGIAAGFDYLETRQDVDSGKIGLLGSSFGGHIAVRVAAFEKRLKAVVSCGGFYGMDEFIYMWGAVLHLQNDMNVSGEQWEQTLKTYTLDGIIDKITCPLLVVNGTADATSPNSQVVKIYDNAKCPKDLKLYEGVGHSGWYWKKSILTDIANWFLVKLNGKHV